MRYHFYIYLLLTKIILGQNEVDIRNLQIKDGIYYQPLDVKPYTGKIINVNKNGNIVLETNCDRGKINGIWRAWYDNGKKEFEGYYKNGYRNGLWKAWHDTGQLWKEGYYFFAMKNFLPLNFPTIGEKNVFYRRLPALWRRLTLHVVFPVASGALLE